MQQQHRARRQPLERRRHRVELHPAGGRIEIWIVLESHSAPRQQRGVIRPRGGAHMHDRVRRGRADELRPQSQGAASAGRLHGAHACGEARLVLVAEDQPLQGLVESGVARRPDVALGALARQQRTLRPAHRVQHRRLAAIVAIHPDTQVHLARIRIGPKRRHEAEDRIGNDGLEPLKHAFCLPRESTCRARRRVPACAPPRTHRRASTPAWHRPA